MKYKHIFFISPPFYSHFNPLLILAKSFKDFGVEVTFGCSIEFKEKIMSEGLNFLELDISKNKNTGKAEGTEQPDSERDRLEEFFSATRQGAIETLITQSRHRKADMLYDPHELIEEIRKIDKELDIDLFVVDILSYSVSLSLYFLELPFITFCPPHPKTIPSKEDYYGVPNNWPSAIEVEIDRLDELKRVSRTTQEEFTRVFNNILQENKNIEKTDNAFALISEIATIYNYFEFDNRAIENNDRNIFIGNCFESNSLDKKWLEKIHLDKKKIMITLGTFLSNREDVLEKLILSVKENYPDDILIVSAGNNVKNLKQYSSENIIIEDFIPQIALMPYMDIVIFHGGCNTFTETIYYGKKMIVLPFSSDQFNIAYDMEVNNLGQVLDPNNFKNEDIIEAFKNLEVMDTKDLEYWKDISRKRGADYAEKKILG